MPAKSEKIEQNRTGVPRPEPDDVKAKQNPEYSREDFEDALERATRRKDEPESPAPGSRRK
jgi:hypothetical protein